MGGPHLWTRLSIDHVDPANRTGNLRPLCYHCNTVRNAGKLTDIQVLRKAHKFWTAQHPDRFLSWLRSPHDEQDDS